MNKFIFRMAFMFATVWYAKRVFTREFYVIGWNESVPFVDWGVYGDKKLTLARAVRNARENVSYMEPEA